MSGWVVPGWGCLGEDVWLIAILVREVWVVDVWMLGSGTFVPPGIGVHRVKTMCASVKITSIIAHSLAF